MNTRRVHLIAMMLMVLMGSSVARLSVAQMTSSSYKIQSDSVNVGGGRSTSASYVGENTVGEVATGESSSTNYKVKAGYQQMQEVYLAITAAADVTMSPTIGGVTGGTSNGSTNFTVTTDSPSGYSVSIKASSSPALVSGSDSFADYTVGTPGTPDFTFALDATTASEFAFSPEGTNLVQKYKDNGSACNTGSSDASDSCWDALSTSANTIVQSTSGNHPSGTATTLKFRAQSGSSHLQPEGIYTATTTVTALAL